MFISNENFKKAAKDVRVQLEIFLKNPASIHTKIKGIYVKILADIFEAIVGAIFIDSEGSIEDVRRVVFFLGERFFSQFKQIIRPPFLQLIKICEENGLGCPSLRYFFIEDFDKLHVYPYNFIQFS